MSQSLNKVKKRIGVVESTKKVTNAMKLVSSVKFSKLSREYKNRQDYFLYLKELASTCFSVASVKHLNVPYIASNPKANARLIVVIGSSMGLCGGYNLNIKKLLESEYKEGDELLLIGKVSLDINKEDNIKINSDFAEILKNFSIKSAEKLALFLLKAFEKNEYKEIVLLYTRYVNSISFIPTKVSILPVEFKLNKKVGLNPGDFEPSIGEFSKILIKQYLTTDLYFKIFESYLSETVSRRNAMDNADKNAEELIDKLTLEYNKARQASITQEITEIVNGSKK